MFKHTGRTTDSSSASSSQADAATPGKRTLVEGLQLTTDSNKRKREGEDGGERDPADDKKLRADSSAQSTRAALQASYGGKVVDSPPKGSKSVAFHYTSEGTAPLITANGIIVSKELSGGASAVGGKNLDGEGFYTTEESGFPYHLPDQTQVKFEVFMDAALFAGMNRHSMDDENISFSDKAWWQDDAELGKFITGFDILERSSGEAGKNELKFNPHMVPFLALVKRETRRPAGGLMAARAESNLRSDFSLTAAPAAEQEFLADLRATLGNATFVPKTVQDELRKKYQGKLSNSAINTAMRNNGYERELPPPRTD